MSDGENDFKDLLQNQTEVLQRQKDVKMKARERARGGVEGKQMEDNVRSERRHLGKDREGRTVKEPFPDIGKNPRMTTHWSLPAPVRQTMPHVTTVTTMKSCRKRH